MDNPITLLSDVIAVLSHVARSSSEYVSIVTKVLQGDRGEKKDSGMLEFFPKIIANLLVFVNMHCRLLASPGKMCNLV